MDNGLSTDKRRDMSKDQVKQLVSAFLRDYDAEGKDQVWIRQRDAFRRFWSDSILTPGKAELSEKTTDPIIRILDRNGKGNTRESEAVARVMVPQGAWRRMFNEFRADRKLGSLVHAIM